MLEALEEGTGEENLDGFGDGTDFEGSGDAGLPEAEDDGTVDDDFAALDGAADFEGTVE